MVLGHGPELTIIDEYIRRQEHHNTTQNKRRLLFGLNVDYIYCIKELFYTIYIINYE